MFRYRIGGVVLSSAGPLSSLEPADEGAPCDYVLERLDGPPPLGDERVFEIGHRDKPTQAFLSVSRQGSEYRLALSGIGVFVVNAGRIAFGLEPGCSEAALEQALVDQVLPRAQHLAGRPCLHASAAHLPPYGAVALCGESGAGKSTLCAALAARGRIVSDDSLTLHETANGLVALPGYASLRLWPDAAATVAPSAHDLERASPRGPKLRLPSSLIDAPVPLALVVALDRSPEADDEPSLEREKGAAAFELVQPHVHRLAPDHPRAIRGEFALVSAIVARVPVLRLRYRPALERIDRIVRLIEAQLRG